MNYRIIVPKNKAAWVALDCNEFIAEQLLQFQLTEDQFNALSALGVISALTRMTETFLNLDEDLIITDIEEMRVIRDAYVLNGNIEDEEFKIVISRIKELLTEAINRKTCVWFFF